MTTILVSASVSVAMVGIDKTNSPTAIAQNSPDNIGAVLLSSKSNSDNNYKYFMDEKCFFCHNLSMEIKRVRQLSLVLLVISTFFVIALAILVRYHNFFNLDVLLSRDFQSISETASHQIYLYYLMTFVSTFGKLIPATILVAFSALIFNYYRYYLQALFTLLTPIAAGINSIIKLIVNRPRPDESLVAVLDRQFDPSFPSGHVVFYIVFFGFMIIALRTATRIPKTIRYPKMIFAGLLILLIPFARVYLGAHWASDVLGGFLIGTILLSTLLLVYFNEKIKHQGSTPNP